MDSFPNDDIEADIYYKTLCSTGLAFIEKQHGQIEQKRNNLIDNKQKLVYSNYDSFIKFSEFSKELINDFQVIENCLINLKQTIPVFQEKCDNFSNDAQKISNRWKNVSLMLAKYPQLIEFLEIPQLLNNCIRTFYYDDALKICAHISKFCNRNSHIAPVFQNFLVEIEKSKDVMIGQIIKEMNGNIQLPECIKLVGYLRQTGRFSENELRVTFLMARDVWLQASLKKSLTNVYSLNYISSITEVFRINIFDIVTQYRAIFPRTELESLTVGQKPQANEIKIINSWMTVKIEQYLNILQECLNSAVSQSGTLSFDATIDHCFYFGLSMSKIGADIRPKLTLIFDDFIRKRFQLRITSVTTKFENSIDDIFKQSSKTEVANFETNLEEFPVILTYINNLLEVFTEVRHSALMSLTSFFATTLNQSFVTITEILRKYLKDHEYTLNSSELRYYLCFCNTFSVQALPVVNRNFQKLCPLSSISQRFGITNLDLGKIVHNFALDIETPIGAINQLVGEISSRL